MNKIIVGVVGAATELGVIRELSQRPHAEVIGVALDLGEGASLRELHDAARSAGAQRCHVVDLREEFARDYVLPAVHGNVWLDGGTVVALARDCIDKTLAAIAELEGASEVITVSRAALVSAERPRRVGAADRSARIEIAFENGIPRAINGIPMALVEVLDSLNTIAAAHGIIERRAAIQLLMSAHRQLGATAAPKSGAAQLELFQGAARATHGECATT